MGCFSAGLGGSFCPLLSASSALHASTKPWQPLTSAAMGQMEDDFRLIAKTLEEVSAQPEADPDAEQLGLF